MFFQTQSQACPQPHETDLAEGLCLGSRSFESAHSTALHPSPQVAQASLGTTQGAHLVFRPDLRTHGEGLSTPFRATPTLPPALLRTDLTESSGAGPHGMVHCERGAHSDRAWCKQLPSMSAETTGTTVTSRSISPYGLQRQAQTRITISQTQTLVSLKLPGLCVLLYPGSPLPSCSSTVVQ